MDRFKKILFAASPGHVEALTLRAAVKLADANDAHLTVLDVLAPLPRARKTMRVEGRVVDIEALLQRDRQERLLHLLENTRGGPNTEAIVTVGEPFVEVIRHVLTHRDDLVIVGDREVEKGVAPQLDAGVMHLLRKCPVPVWVMRPSGASGLRTLASVDPDPSDPIRDGLNDLILQLATSLASREGGELHVGHAWSLAGESSLRLSPYLKLPGIDVDALVQAEEATHREHLEALAMRHRVNEMGGSVHLVSGDPRDALPRLARLLDIGLIVMGTVARTGVSGLLMGNTAETILRSVDCSVLAVKPEGFVTPVKLGGRRT